MTGRAAAIVPGTWGELVQGTSHGAHVLITCPVNRYAVAIARSGAVHAGGWTGPPGRSRTAAALARVPGGGRVRLRSPLRPGAGMASSTADLCAALTAAHALAGIRLTPRELFDRCLALEPTDGLMFSGLALVDHIAGERSEVLGAPPPLAILGVDPGGSVATEWFNGRPELAELNRRKEPLVREALAMAVKAIAVRDPAQLAAAATLSARAHQAILPHPLWERASALAPACGALGVNVAHSGTVLGFLFDERESDLPAASAWLSRQLGLPVQVLRLIGGGVTLIEGG